MPGHGRPKDGVARLVYDLRIHEAVRHKRQSLSQNRSVLRPRSFAKSLQRLEIYG
jgi:hypothetical protein